MSRLLFWIALAALVVAAVRSKLGALRPPPGQAGQPGQPPRGADGQGEPMTCCAHCGLYFPASEALAAEGRDYCCPAHLRLPPRPR